jgi:glycosyltransferase involved in cell wall biosynthesis
MPLPDTPYTRGKCSYKLLQYAAAGLPAVGSAVGVNVDVLKRTSGRAASGTDEWVGAMESLLDASVAERTAIGQRASDGVVAGYSFAAWAATWRELVDVEGAAA